MNKVKNYAFIDGQNLYLGISTDGWSVDFKKLRVYLRDKYNVSEVYYFIGYFVSENIKFYSDLKNAGFSVVFKEQTEDLISHKKGNIDTDMIFKVMESLLEKGEDFNKILLITGDGDFKILVDYLIKKGRLEKILFPNKKRTSSLYKPLKSTYKDFLLNLKHKIEYKKEKLP